MKKTKTEKADPLATLFTTYPQYRYTRIDAISSNKTEKWKPKTSIKIIDTNIIAILNNDISIYSAKRSFMEILAWYTKKNIITKHEHKNKIPDNIISEISIITKINIFVISDTEIKWAPCINNLTLCYYQSPDFIYYNIILSEEEILIIKKQSIVLHKMPEERRVIKLKVKPRIVPEQFQEECQEQCPEKCQEQCPTIINILSYTYNQLMRLKLAGLQDIAINRKLNIYDMNNKRFTKAQLATLILKL